MTLTNDNNKSVVLHTGVPAVPPPPPPPGNFTLEFKNLVAAFDGQRKKFAALEAQFEKRNYPVREFIDPSENDLSASAMFLLDDAKSLLEKLQALWPEENLHHHASRQCIGVRLNGMAQRLPRSENADPKSLIERIEAELPSPMVLESTCRELEDDLTRFPLPTDILPVLKKQKSVWANRMAAVDVVRIEQLSIDWEKARQEQYAIFEKALRGRLASAGHADLLAILEDPDQQVSECVHYVSAITNLRRENCTELADKLLRCFDTVQRGGYENYLQAVNELQEAYTEAWHVIPKRRQQRESEERQQAYEEDQRQQQEEEHRKMLRRNIEIRRRERDRAEEHERCREQEMWDALERAREEHWEAIALEYDPWAELDAETIALIKNGVIPHQLTKKEIAERKEKALIERTRRVIQEQRDKALRELQERLRMIEEDLESERDDRIDMIRELEERLSNLERDY